MEEDSSVITSLPEKLEGFLISYSVGWFTFQMNTNKKWNVSKYAWWDYSKSKWIVPVELGTTSAKLTLILKGTRLLLINKNTAIESLDLIHKTKQANVFVKNGCMVLVAKCGESYRKFKVLFQTIKDAEDCAHCVQIYIKTVVEKRVQDIGTNNQQPTNSYGRSRSTFLQGGGQTLPEILEQIMSNAKPSLPAADSISEDYPLESAVRLCILEPGFPKLVQKVEFIINKSYK
ncbi:hypothetical protein GE061_006043 [Apolygus lucorum]|uniref:Uncharacterized protein n=1 Tax=Apolygus lucorum TaxID=248454 RepID=A0A8S9WWP3_APOLU|nr:hypothetical protein GE061_006043 [Apolygus lucorum]